MTARLLAAVRAWPCNLGHRADWNGFHCRRCGASPAFDAPRWRR